MITWTDLHNIHRADVGIAQLRIEWKCGSFDVYVNDRHCSTSHDLAQAKHQAIVAAYAKCQGALQRLTAALNTPA